MIPAASALAAIAIAAYWYARREEPVRGRLVGATLRACVLFLLFSALWLPGLSAPPADGIAGVALVDLSRSMALPASGDSSWSRIDSALAVLPGLSPDAVFTFGSSVKGPDIQPREEMAVESESRALRAVEAAALAGADSVWILTDGGLDDREEVLRSAERVGLGVREVRVSTPRSRVGLVAVEHAPTIGSGDTLRLSVTLATVAGAAPLPDSVGIRVRTQDGNERTVRATVPTAGRTALATVDVVMESTGSEPGWQALEVLLEPGADPFGVADRTTTWVEVGPSGRGTVLISLEPDWEAGYLTPVLERSSAGNVRTFLRLDGDRFLRVGLEPRAAAGVADVGRSVVGAGLVVIQARPEGIPAWLVSAAAEAPAVLYLVRGTGPLPGTTVSVEQVIDGEWYPAAELPSSPLAGLLAGVSFEGLPPLSPLFAASNSGEWSPLLARKDRRGDSRPVAIAGTANDRRWAAVLAAGTWRWAGRGGSSRQAYRGLYGGLVGWLLDARREERITLLDAAPAAGQPLGWRIAPGVRDLAVTVRDSAGGVLWSQTIEDPDTVLVGPALNEGAASYEATGTSSGDAFTEARPFSVDAPIRELGPRRLEAPIWLEAAASDGPARSGRAVWPFLLAAVLLCAEWLWRRRVGLR